MDKLLVGMRSVGERVDELSALVRRVRAKVEAGLTEETKRMIVDLLDLAVRIGVEGEQRYADVVCHLTLGEARLRIVGVDDVSTNTTGTRTCTRSSAAP